MSLKAFHIVFVTASVLLAFWFGWFELTRHGETKAALDLWLGIGSCGAGVGLYASLGAPPRWAHFLRRLLHPCLCVLDARTRLPTKTAGAFRPWSLSGARA